MRNIFLIVLLFLTSKLMFSQTMTIGQFESLRSEKINSNEDYTTLEKTFAQQGTLPTAYFLSRNETSVEFHFYKTISSEKQEIYAQRFKSMFPFIHEIEYVNSNRLRVYFTSSPNETELLDFLKVMGYEGYRQ
jgi:hypothetical protein